MNGPIYTTDDGHRVIVMDMGDHYLIRTVPSVADALRGGIVSIFSGRVNQARLVKIIQKDARYGGMQGDWWTVWGAISEAVKRHPTREA